MVNISDILKRGRDEEDHPQKRKPEEAKAKEKKISPGPAEELKKKEGLLEAKKELKIAPVVMGKTKVAAPPEVEKIYQDLITLIEEISARAQKHESIEGKNITDKVDKVVNQVALTADEIIGLTNGSTPENYLYAHSVNVCLLSIRIGLGLGYNKSKLNELGVSGFLHDLGMLKLLDIAQRSQELVFEEYEAVKQHPLAGVEILEKVKDLPKTVIDVVHQHHERIDGSGYPRGLKGVEISEDAQLVGLIDVFDALTHPRSHRKRLLAYTAMREILKSKLQFDSQLLKALIEEIGLYPAGSWVELNTGEVARVVKVNHDFPLQPALNVMLDPNGRKLERAKSIELTNFPTLYIKQPLLSVPGTTL